MHTQCSDTSYDRVEYPEKISFTLADKPIITFGNGELIINGDAETSYAIRDIKGYYFTEDKDNGIENQLANKLRIIKIDEIQSKYKTQMHQQKSPLSDPLVSYYLQWL